MTQLNATMCLALLLSFFCIKPCVTMADEVANFRGLVGSHSGWQVVNREEGKVVYIPFEGYYESKGGRAESPKFALDKTSDENAWYSLSFSAKSDIDGYWWVRFDGVPMEEKCS